MPPPKRLSKFLDPGEHLHMPCLFFHNSSAVTKSEKTSFLAESTMLSTVLKPIPVFSAISLGGITATASTVVIPAERSLPAVAEPTPSSFSNSKLSMQTTHPLTFGNALHNQ